LERALKRYENDAQLVLYPFALNPRSEIAVQFALCAGEQGKFWEVHKMLYKQQSSWSSASQTLDTLLKYSGELGLDKTALEACVDSGKMRPLVKADQEYARSLQVRSTPTLFINNRRIVGAQSEAEIVRTIRQELARVRRAQQPSG
jgi:protein-disulfide isomerase